MASPLLRLLSSPRARRNALLAVLWAVILATLFAVREVLLPFLIAVFLAYVIDPVVRRLSVMEWRGRRMPRFAAVLTIYAGAFLFFWASAVFVLPQLSGEVEKLWRTSARWLTHVDQEELEKAAVRLDELAQRLGMPVRVIATADTGDEALEPLPGADFTAPLVLPADELDEDFYKNMGDLEEAPVWTVNLSRELRTIASTFVSELQKRTGAIAVQLQAVVGGLLGFFFKFFLVLMLTAFLATDTDRIKRFFFSLLPIEDRESYDELLERIDRGLSGVVRGQLTICFVNGLLTLLGLLLFQVKFAFLLAIVAALFSLIPIFGSIASTVPIVFVALATGGPGSAVLMLAWVVGIHALEANLLNPKIMGESAKIHPVVVVLALVAGEHFYGIPGALFAVPVTSIGLTLFRSLQARASRLERTSVPPPPRPSRRASRPHRDPPS